MRTLLAFLSSLLTLLSFTAAFAQSQFAQSHEDSHDERVTFGWWGSSGLNVKSGSLLFGGGGRYSMFGAGIGMIVPTSENTCVDAPCPQDEFAVGADVSLFLELSGSTALSATFSRYALFADGDFGGGGAFWIYFGDPRDTRFTLGAGYHSIHGVTVSAGAVYP